MRSPQAVKLRITLRDNKNRLFDNFTSLVVSWSSSNYDMASFDLANVGVGSGRFVWSTSYKINV